MTQSNFDKTTNRPSYPRMPDTDLDSKATAHLARAIAKADAINAEIGVSGPEVAEYNLRVGRLRLLEKRRDALTGELARSAAIHNVHPVTVKIREWEDRRDAEIEI